MTDLGEIAIIISAISMVGSIANNFFTFRRDKRESKNDRAAECRTIHAPLEAGMQKLGAELQKVADGAEAKVVRAHARMDGIEGNYNSKFREVRADVKAVDDRLRVVDRRTEVIAINLKNFMAQNNFELQTPDTEH